MRKKGSKFMDEFKEFALRGSVMDLAVGVIVGAAFAKITTSLVEKIIMPFIALFTGTINFDEIVIKLGPIFPDSEAAVIGIGAFVSAVIDFIIIAFVVFLMVKGINRLRMKQKAETAAPPEPPQPNKEELLLAEIRDILKEKG